MGGDRDDMSTRQNVWHGSVGAPAAGPSTVVHEAPSAHEAPGVPPEGLDEAAPESCVRGRSVLVPLHGRRAHFVGALEIARLIARALQTPLRGLFVGPEPIDASEVPAHVGLAPEALHGVVLEVAVSDDRAGAVVEATERRATAFVVVTSDPDEAIDERLGIGELAASALHAAACGVVVMGPAALGAPRLRRMLLPLDGTPSTAAAIAPAGELARTLDAELDIVMVGLASPRGQPARDEAPAASTPEPGAMTPPLYVDQPHHEWAAFTEEFLDRFLTAIGHCPPDVSTRFFLGAGEPAAEILRFAGELSSDLVVLVWHGQLDGQHGAVFCDVLRNASCPVLVLRR
jgi:nucleotide-binding universal stress UspA family protein